MSCGDGEENHGWDCNCEEFVPRMGYWLNVYPTDATFVLQPEGVPPREYFIEGKGWNRLDEYWDVAKQRFTCTEQQLYFLWYDMDDPDEWGWEQIPVRR